MSIKIELKPCPFCGFQVDRYGLDDVLYPSGISWREHDDPDIGRHYVGGKDRKPGDKSCYEIVCNGTMGGCGAEMHADSKEEVIKKWNGRVYEKR